MKKCCVLIFLFLHVMPARSQQHEIEQLLLDVEKLVQFKQIVADMKAGYDILVRGYNEIRDVSEGNFSLHQAFLEGMLQASPAVANYHRVTRIISMQKELIRGSVRSYAALVASKQFSKEELEHIRQIGKQTIAGSVEHLGALANILTANRLRMSDAERLSAIDELFVKVDEQRRFLQQFYNNGSMLALQRFKDFKDMQKTKVLHGIK